VLRSKDGTGEENKINQRREREETENDKRTGKNGRKEEGRQGEETRKKRQWETAEMEKLGSQVTRLFQLSVVDLGPRYHRL